jgi:hypothetical protein
MEYAPVSCWIASRGKVSMAKPISSIFTSIMVTLKFSSADLFAVAVEILYIIALGSK